MAGISDLKKWDEVDKQAQNNLLLGNGFSIQFALDFLYSSLRKKSIEYKYLSEDDQLLFTLFATTDFEFLLRRLRDTSIVNDILGIDSETPLEKYRSVQDALIQTIGRVHPNADIVSETQRLQLADTFKNYDSIFTTNYDLLLYWIMGSVNFKGFTDFFWSGGNLTFDPFNTDVWNPHVTKIFYLHGSLFIFTNQGRTYKLRRKTGDESLIDEVKVEIESNSALPLFVSEGRAEDKENALRRNSYLTFAFNEYKKINNGLTIYGSSLNPLSDGHILQAITKNRNLKVIAVSIYTKDRSPTEIVDAMTDIEVNLRKFKNNGGQIEFYDYSTSPLSIN